MPTKLTPTQYAYSTDETLLIKAKARDHRMKGNSQAARWLLRRLDNGEWIEGQEYALRDIKPEKQVLNYSTLEVPRASGKGSSTAVWQEFAKQVSTMEPEVIDSLSRADIISILVEKGIIEDPVDPTASKTVEVEVEEEGPVTLEADD